MIKFNCPHCQQALRVPVSRADTEATCPGCQTQIRVPPAIAVESADDNAIAAPPVVQAADDEGDGIVDLTNSQLQSSTAAAPEAEQIVSGTVVDFAADDLNQGSYQAGQVDQACHADGVSEESESSFSASADEQHESAVSDAEAANESNHRNQRELLKDRRRKVEVSSKVFEDLADRVAEDTLADTNVISHRRTQEQLGVARSNLYLFGVLILFVALTSFWLGTMMNPTRPSQSEAEIAGVEDYVNFEGRVTFRTEDDPEAVDEAALVMLLPQDSLPSEKFIENGIGAGLEVDESLPTVQEIRRLGGDITTAGAEGRFTMKVASGNYYYLLVVSAQKPSAEPPEEADLESLGAYFNSPARLLDGKTYRWSQEVVNTHRDIRVYHR